MVPKKKESKKWSTFKPLRSRSPLSPFHSTVSRLSSHSPTHPQLNPNSEPQVPISQSDSTQWRHHETLFLNFATESNPPLTLYFAPKNPKFPNFTAPFHHFRPGSVKFQRRVQEIVEGEEVDEDTLVLIALPLRLSAL